MSPTSCLVAQIISLGSSTILSTGRSVPGYNISGVNRRMFWLSHLIVFITDAQVGQIRWSIKSPVRTLINHIPPRCAISRSAHVLIGARTYYEVLLCEVSAKASCQKMCILWCSIVVKRPVQQNQCPPSFTSALPSTYFWSPGKVNGLAGTSDSTFGRRSSID